MSPVRYLAIEQESTSNEAAILLLTAFSLALNLNPQLVAQTTATTFTQSGTGATTRPLAAKLGDIVNVKDFGAVCDGATLDTAAIDAAINSAHQGIEFPEGTCLYANTNGSGSVLYSYLANKQIYSSSRTIVSFTNSGSSSNQGVGWHFQNCTNLTIKGLTFTYQTAPSVRTSGSPFWIDSSTNVFLSDIAVQRSPGVGMFFTVDTGLQANNLQVQNTLSDGIQNQDMIGMVETNLYISNTGDDGLSMHCVGTTTGAGGTPITACASTTTFPNYGMAGNIVADHIGTFGPASGGKAISIDGGKGITVNGIKATNIGVDCVQVYSDSYAHGNVPDAIILNDIGCSNVGIAPGATAANGIEVDQALNVYINNPNINGTSLSSPSLGSGIYVDYSTANVWVNGGVVQNTRNVGVEVDVANLFHMVGTEIRKTQTKGVVVNNTADVRLSNILIYDAVVANGGGDNYRAVNLESDTGLLDVHNITIQDDQSPARGYVFFTGGITANGTIDGVTGYVSHGSLQFNNGSTDNIVRRNFSGRGATLPGCNASTEGLTWYVNGSGGTAGVFQICQYQSTGGYSWQSH